MKSHITTKDLLKVKSALPMNGMNEVATRTKLSLSTVSRVLNGKTKKNIPEILRVSLEIIDEEKAKALETKMKIDSL